MRNHLMIDFETLGTGERAAVVSLGACLFNKGGIFATNEWTYELKEQETKFPRRFQTDVIKWWMKQSPDARKVFMLPGEVVTLNEWVDDFEAWLSMNEINPKDLLIWSNGGDFDIPIYCDIYRQLDRQDPIPFWNHTCFRTADRILKLKANHERKGTHHKALDDSVYQAECLINYWNRGTDAKN